jgi:hypothetical protein
MVFLHLHIRIQTEPLASVDVMLSCMRSIYEPNDLIIRELSRQPLDMPDLDSFGVSITDVDLTEDEQLLFSHRDGISDQEICAYFVDEIKLVAANSTQPLFGTSIKPPRLPTVVIARDAPKWTLAHEVGHVLGLAHDEMDVHRLMYATGDPTPIELPYLVWKEMSTIFKSPTLLHDQ